MSRAVSLRSPCRIERASGLHCQVQLEIGRGGQCNNFDAQSRTRIPKRDAAWMVRDTEMFHVITWFFRVS